MAATTLTTTRSRVQTRSQTRSGAQLKSVKPITEPTRRPPKNKADAGVNLPGISIAPQPIGYTAKAKKSYARKASGKDATQGASRTLRRKGRTTTKLESTSVATPLPEVNGADSVADLTHERDADRERHRRAALADVREPVTVDATCLKDLYKATVSDRRIKNFLAASSLYDYGSNTWNDIPNACQDEQELYEPFLKVTKAIIDGLGNARGIRQVVDTRKMKLFHFDDPAQFSNPGITIRAIGPSFVEPVVPEGQRREPKPIGFRNTASVFDVKREADVREVDVDQLAVYNGEIFCQQPNRLFCRSLLLTETHVRLLHCDRSGAYKTRSLNIHEDPSTFVRLVLGLSSPSEAILGFDTSVQWTVKNGKRVSGSITTLNALGKRIKYQLNMAKHVIVTGVVRGRGTVCWHAKDKDGKSILLKDSWRTDGQKPEHTFLERAKGLVGVAQMIAFEDNRAETKLFRPASFDFTIAGFDNRTMCRVTMPCYGLAVHEFTSQAQAIAALRDAIQGHLTLLKVGLLHQDVSIDNILLGEDAAPAGFRGILIDLEMAVHVTGPAARIIDKHHQAGTRLYQSVSVVDARSHLPRDYIDDLESFFYVLCHLLYGFEGVNVQFPDAFGPDSVLGEWERRTPRMASYRKEIYITMEGPAYRAPPPFWSVACINLCDKYRKFLAPLIDAKGHIRRKHPSLITREELQEIYSGVDNHYADVLAMFDTALVELSKPGGSDPRPAPPAQRTPESSVNSYISTSGSSSTSPPLKRPLGHLEELDTPSAKRQRLNFNDLNAHDGSSSHSD